MLTPVPQSPDDRGTRWLHAQVQQILAEAAVPLAAPRTEGDPSCFWGTDRDTATTLYVRLEGEADPRALAFPRLLIADCGAGKYARQGYARMFIRRMLTKMGILSA
jgi:hypothetical protein